jgi:hypothetical protein
MPDVVYKAQYQISAGSLLQLTYATVNLTSIRITQLPAGNSPVLLVDITSDVPDGAAAPLPPLLIPAQQKILVEAQTEFLGEVVPGVIELFASLNISLATTLSGAPGLAVSHSWPITLPPDATGPKSYSISLEFTFDTI